MFWSLKYWACHVVGTGHLFNSDLKWWNGDEATLPMCFIMIVIFMKGNKMCWFDTCCNIEHHLLDLTSIQCYIRGQMAFLGTSVKKKKEKQVSASALWLRLSLRFD